MNLSSTKVETSMPVITTKVNASTPPQLGSAACMSRTENALDSMLDGQRNALDVHQVHANTATDGQMRENNDNIVVLLLEKVSQLERECL